MIIMKEIRNPNPKYIQNKIREAICNCLKVSLNLHDDVYFWLSQIWPIIVQIKQNIKKKIYKQTK